MSPVAQAAVLVAFPVSAAVAGSVAAVLRRPGPRLTSGIQHFAAGVVMAALVGEVLPGLREEGNLPWAVVGFASGVAVLLALSGYSRKREKAQASRLLAHGAAARTAAVAVPLALLATVAIDLLLDGLLVGLGATLGATQGLILTIALTIEILFLGLSLAAELVDSGLSRTRAAVTCSVVGLSTAVGAVGGAALLGDATKPVLAAVLAFGAAALLYLAVEVLLVEAHEEDESTLLAAMFFLGFLGIYVLGEIAS